MRVFAAIVALVLGLSFLARSDVKAFGTLNAAGQSAEHERITRAALAFLGKRTLDELAGKSGTFGAIGAPDRPGRGMLTLSEAHCDNGDHLPPKIAAGYPQTEEAARAVLASCRAWIFSHLDAAVAVASPLSALASDDMALGCPFDGETGSAKCRVIEALGVAMHAAQDFYSHSNWTDQPLSGALSALNPPGLANEGPAPWLDPRGDTPFPDGLISGCFKSLPEDLFCNYGGVGPILSKDRVKHGALNKDKGPIGQQGATGPGRTLRGAAGGNFRRAVGAAIADTSDKWAYFEERVLAVYGAEDGARILCAMWNDDRNACGA